MAFIAKINRYHCSSTLAIIFIVLLFAFLSAGGYFGQKVCDRGASWVARAAWRRDWWGRREAVADKGDAALAWGARVWFFC